MKILHVIRKLDPKQGGPPVVAARLAAAQAALGHEVGILTYDEPDARERTAKSLAGIPGFAAVRVHTILREPTHLARFRAAELNAWLASNTAGHDFLHLHGVWNALLPAAAGHATRAGRPYAVVPHGMLDPWCLSGQGLLKSLKKKIALALSYRRMLDGAAFLHVLNADEGRLLEPLRLRPPAVVLPNGVFEDEVSPLPAPGTFRATHPELGQDPYILFLSRLHFKKGLDFLVDAFASLLPRHPTARLVLAGPDDGMVATLSEQTRALGISDRIHLVGLLHGRDKLAAFVDSTVFCLPSRQEGFSMAITEALACRKPVVISDQCHFPEVVDAGAGLVTPLGAGPTAEALDRVLSLPPADAAAMGHQGHALVMGRFTWPRIAERTLRAYGQVLAGQRPTG